MGSRPTTCVLDRARKVTSPLRATSGDADHLAHFGEANIKIADGNICGRNSHNHLVLFAEPLGGIKRPIAGLGILALSRAALLLLMLEAVFTDLVSPSA
jgi:hypothetical protein